jgi:hypothetical protein
MNNLEIFREKMIERYGDYYGSMIEILDDRDLNVLLTFDIDNINQNYNTKKYNIKKERLHKIVIAFLENKFKYKYCPPKCFKFKRT